ncbi:MAG: ExeM/NucH family extracellular endonuclease [Acidimicrobiia bacterium]
MVLVLAVTPLTVLAPVAVPRAQAATAELFFSEYVEGSSLNKALEIYNGTGVAVDLGAGGYSVQMFFNGSTTAGLTLSLTGTIANGDVFVVAQTTADAAILAQADQLTAASWYNGDDAVVLRKGATVLDAIGQIGVDPGTEWGTGLVSTADNTLQRKASICQGDTNGSDGFDPAVEWDGFAQNTFTGLGTHTANCAGADVAPTVLSTTPANGVNGIARGADVVVTFSEPVDVTGAWFTISCATSGAHTAVVSGGPTSFTLNPDADFAANELCTVTVVAANVTDQDATDPPDTMDANTAFSFTTVDAAVCGDPATPIHDIQGSGLSSPLVGATNVTIEGVVVGDYQGPGQFSGYYVQEEDAQADANPLTSEGIFVFNTTFPVAAGDIVRVRGNVVEFTSSGITLTELTSVSSTLVCVAGGASVTPAQVTLPVAAVSDWERYEGMRITLPQQLTATETFTLGRFGEVSLSVGGRLLNPTSIVDPGAPAIAQQDLNNRSRILLDDGNNQQNIDPTIHPIGGLSAANTLRSGYTTSGFSGVLDQRFGVYRVQPVAPVTFSADNPRPASPADVGGSLKVASMNVLNYFNGNGTGVDGPAGGFPTARGAINLFELGRQQAKLVAALAGIDADVVGFMEIENDASGPTSALAQLTGALNNALGAGTYSYIDTGVVGTDEIRVALIYKPAAVTPVGAFQTLTSADDPLFIDTANRPALAQTFGENINGQKFTVVVNHLKSKGSPCAGDPDTGDGQGNCNITRTNAAIALANWLETDPTGSGDPDFLIIGDLNAYAKEDPIKALEADGYFNLTSSYLGAGAYSYVFDGQSGYLDHALANATLAPQVTGVAEWHINADEPIVMDYTTEFKSANHINTLYAPTPFRASDHDPVIIGVCQAPTLSVSVTPNELKPPNHKYRTVVATPTKSGDVVDLELISATSNEPDNGLGDGDTANDIVIVNDLTVQLRAERSGTGTGRIYTMTWRATNSCGATVTATATVSVPK